MKIENILRKSGENIKIWSLSAKEKNKNTIQSTRRAEKPVSQIVIICTEKRVLENGKIFYQRDSLFWENAQAFFEGRERGFLNYWCEIVEKSVKSSRGDVRGLLAFQKCEITPEQESAREFRKMVKGGTRSVEDS